MGRKKASNDRTSRRAARLALGASLLVPVCTGDGLVHMVQVPVDGQQAPGGSNGACCAKGCHAGSSRKRSLKNFAPAQ